MIRKLLRLVFSLVGAVFGYAFYELLKAVSMMAGASVVGGISATEDKFFGIIFALLFFLIFFRIIPLLQKHSYKLAWNIESEMENVSLNRLISGTIGLIAGLIIAFLISGLYDGIKVPMLPTILNIITYLILGFIGVVIATSKGMDTVSSILNASKISSVGGKGKKQTDVVPKIFDTSVIIDGRISDIMKTGFLEGPIVIPEFVLVELRHIADSSDSLKRQRGRRGLDILNKIQEEYGIEIYNTNDEKTINDIPEVDVKLLKLAQIMNGKVVTNDFNLNKVAGVKGIPVLNINELANTLKPIVLPGEEMILTLVKAGKERNQAVAYLDDGTMIVVEEGKPFIGQTLKVVVTSVLQTSAGRMIFAKPGGNM